MTNVTENIAETTSSCAHSVSGVLDKARGVLANTRDTLVHAAPVEKVRAGVRTLDDYAHKAPWSLIGGAVVVALAVGYLLRRR